MFRFDRRHTSGMFFKNLERGQETKTKWKNLINELVLLAELMKMTE